MNLRCAEFCSNLLQNYFTDPGAHWTNANSKKHSHNDWKYVGAGKDIIFCAPCSILKPVEAFCICSNSVVKFLQNYCRADFTVKMMINGKNIGGKVSRHIGLQPTINRISVLASPRLTQRCRLCYFKVR